MYLPVDYVCIESQLFGIGLKYILMGEDRNLSEKIVLIDGHSILHRAFYGIPDLSNSEGLHTNAVYGFLNIMLKILEEEQPEYLAVAFDRKEPTFRHELYQEYKGTRKPMPEELREQVPVIQEVLLAMNIPVISQAGYEADDILGTLAVRAQERGMEVSLVSGDRDLLQLASDKILIRIPKTKRSGTEIEDYHTSEVIDKYGITPSQIIDMKGLMGDTADNIPGVAGVGEKTAGKILAAFPTVEEVYEHLEEVEPKRVRELLRKGRELAFLSKKLATINTDCPLDFSFEQAVYENLFTKEAYQWIKKLELRSLEKRFDKEVVSGGGKSELSFEVITAEEEAGAFFEEVAEKWDGRISVGVLADEWSNAGAVKKKTKKAKEGQISLILDGRDLSLSVEEEEKEIDYSFLGISLTFKEREAGIRTVCLPVSEKLSAEYLIQVFSGIASQAERIYLLDWKNIMHSTTPVEKASPEDDLPNQQVFADKTAEDRQKLFQKIADVSVGAYLLNPMKDNYQADSLAMDYLGITLPSVSEYFGIKRLAELTVSQEYVQFITAPERGSEIKDKLTKYLAWLSWVPYQVQETVFDELQEKGMAHLMEEIEIPTAYYLYQMEREGVQVDRDELQRMSEMLEKQVTALETDIYDLAGEEFNINSPKQLGVILFEKLKLPFGKKTKRGYSTSAEILEKLKGEDPIITKILDYRQVAKLKSTYADGLPVFIDRDKRIHGKFNQTITATGRISSTDPNLQNIPIRTELGRELRGVFKAKEGCVFLDADYSQIELRVLAHMSGDGDLIQAYRDGQDIHRSTAAKVFHTPFDEVTEQQRRNAKAVNFGIVYGISAFGLSQDLNISRTEAQGYINQYFAMYPAVKEFIDGLVKTAKDKGYAETLFGRRRPIPELASNRTRSFGERVAMNSPIQGTAADIIKLAMIRVAGRLAKEELKAKIVLQVHDELLVETPEEEREQVRRILLEEMQGAVALSVPLWVDVQEGRDWKEAH